MSEIYWAGGRRWKRVLGSGTMIGIYAESAAPGVTLFSATIPLPGAWLLSEIQIEFSRSPVATLYHAAQFALVTDVPTAQADMDGGEQLFPWMTERAGQESSVYFIGNVWNPRMPIGRAMFTNGRRIGLGLLRSGSTTADCVFRFHLEELTPVRDDQLEEDLRAGVLAQLATAAAAARGS